MGHDHDNKPAPQKPIGVEDRDSGASWRVQLRQEISGLSFDDQRERLRPPSPSASPTQNNVQFNVTEASERAAGAQGAPQWPIAANDSQEIDTLLPNDQQAAFARLVTACAGHMPNQSRVVFELTANAGGVGETATLTASNSSTGTGDEGACIPFLPSGIRDAGQMRAYVQINPRLIQSDVGESRARLHSTLMHEYTHAEQYFAMGIAADARFETRGEVDRLSLGQADADQITGLQEIEAYCLELENASVTGITSSIAVGDTLSGLVRNYSRYWQESHQNVDARIANRVGRATHTGRGHLMSFVASPEARQQAEETASGSARISANDVLLQWLGGCPRISSGDRLMSFVTDAQVTADLTQQNGELTALRTRLSQR